MKLEVTPKGPTGYENWLAYINNEKPTCEFEIQFYSDADIVGDVPSGCGPYSFFNALPSLGVGSFAHVVTARIKMSEPPTLPDMSRTDVSRYHGGWIGDELSALCSLAMGIRLRSGSISRDFYEDDPKGRPRADTESPQSPLPKRQQNWIVPQARNRHDIHKALIPRLFAYPALKASEAVTLVRAARLYQDAIWIVESAPEVAWLLLVSAVEVVATHHQVDSFAAKEIFEIALPEFYAELTQIGGEEFVNRCATHMERHLRATNRFLSFLKEFLPPPPPRPFERVVEVNWEHETLKKAFSKIYNYRSRALHDGTPFPRPMCDPPSCGEWHHEQMSAIAASSCGGVWRSGDIPMFLHVFEHVTRNTILNWWDSVAFSNRLQ